MSEEKRFPVLESRDHDGTRGRYLHDARRHASENAFQAVLLVNV